MSSENAPTGTPVECLVGHRVPRRSPWDIAESWYTIPDVAACVRRHDANIPNDVQSEQFARWLTHEYRLAMAKGIQLGREGTED